MGKGEKLKNGRKAKKQEEKRRHTRAEVIWPVKMDIKGKIIDGETSNIASEGISIICHTPLPIDEVVYMSLEPHDQQAIEFYGKVVWSDVYGIDEKDQAHGVGICFIQIARKDRKRYNDLVDLLMGS